MIDYCIEEEQEERPRSLKAKLENLAYRYVEELKQGIVINICFSIHSSVLNYKEFVRTLHSLVHSYRMSISMSSIIEPALLMWGLTLASNSITLVCCLVMHPDRLVSPTCGGERGRGRKRREGAVRKGEQM